MTVVGGVLTKLEKAPSFPWAGDRWWPVDWLDGHARPGDGRETRARGTAKI